MGKPILCLDFDGVIHSYTSGWRGAHVIPDAPMPGVGKFLLDSIRGFEVHIFSSRSKSIRGRWAMRRYIRDILWDACLADLPEASAAWEAATGIPGNFDGWTAYDVRDDAEEILKLIKFPWFKPPAMLTIDDRAIQFKGEWPTIADMQAFKPWKLGSAP